MRRIPCSRRSMRISRVPADAVYDRHARLRSAELPTPSRAAPRPASDAHLIVFDAMPHAHWYSIHLPEAKEAFEAQARFLDRHLS